MVTIQYQYKKYFYHECMCLSKHGFVMLLPRTFYFLEVINVVSLKGSTWFQQCLKLIHLLLWYRPCLIHTIWSSLSDPSRLEESAEIMNDLLISQKLNSKLHFLICYYHAMSVCVPSLSDCCLSQIQYMHF